MNRKIIFALLIMFLGCHAMVGCADSLTTAQLMQRTLQGASEDSCLNYRIKGICFWLVCDTVYCHVKSTLKVSHYLPDAVVSVYRTNHSNPWDFAKTVIDPLSYQLGQTELRTVMGSATMGFGNENSTSTQNLNNHFKETDVIGNPAVLFFKSLPKLFLPSKVQAFMPYYLSMADSVLWRSPLKEMALYPEYLIPGVREVGNLLDDWGNVFPRVGFIEQPQDAKAAAVIATRGVDIAAQFDQPHIYQPMPASCGKHCKIMPVKENAVAANTWQMVYPIADNQCAIFGKNDLSDATPWGNNAYQQGDGNYVWVLWRHYQGCIPSKGQYLYEINF